MHQSKLEVAFTPFTSRKHEAKLIKAHLKLLERGLQPAQLVELRYKQLFGSRSIQPATGAGQKASRHSCTGMSTCERAGGDAGGAAGWRVFQRLLGSPYAAHSPMRMTRRWIMATSH